MFPQCLYIKTKEPVNELFITEFTSELARGNLNVSSCVCLGTETGRLPGNFKVFDLYRIANGSTETDA